MAPNCQRKSFESRRKNKKFTQISGTIDFLILVQVYRNPLRGEHPNIHIFINDVTTRFT